MNKEEKEKRLKLIERLNMDKSRFGQTTIGADNIKLFINLLYQSLTECVDIVAQNEDDSVLQLSEYELNKMRMFVSAKREEHQQKIDEILKTKHTQVDTKIDDSGDVVFNVSPSKQYTNHQILDRLNELPDDYEYMFQGAVLGKKELKEVYDILMDVMGGA